MINKPVKQDVDNACCCEKFFTKYPFMKVVLPLIIVAIGYFIYTTYASNTVTDNLKAPEATQGISISTDKEEPTATSAVSAPTAEKQVPAKTPGTDIKANVEQQPASVLSK